MLGFTAERAALESQPIVVLADDTGRRVRIACHGAALLSFEVPRGGGRFDLAWGYHDATDIVARTGSHFAILAPFAGRVRDARYHFAGRIYDLQPGVRGRARGIRHGFVRDADFTVAELAAGANSARVTLATEAMHLRPGYPFCIDLAVSFMLDASGLALEVRMRNSGEQAAPCFCGWHAYLRPADGRADDWVLEIPARSIVRTDAQSIPLAGKAAYNTVAESPALDFSQPRRIGVTVLDNGYADLIAGDDGRLHSRLTDPATGCWVGTWQERGVLQAFTGDTLPAGARSAVALEPMESLADAFNCSDCAAAIRLAPGAERIFRCGLEFGRT
ncbi:MAG: aldose 1-epimerase [Gammaproteobacteria bacterium]